MNILPSDYRWHISNSNSKDYVEGNIRSFLSGHIIYPKLEWEYFTINIINCTTDWYKFPHLIIDMVVGAQALASYDLSQCLASMFIETPFDNALYLSSLQSNLSM